MITISEYAKKYNKSPVTIRQSCQRGRFKTAKKVGRDWLIDENEPFVDKRIKTGKYKKS